MDFPCVAQVALLRRHLRQHAPETVALVTSLPPAELNAAQWVECNRAAWVIGMFRRFSNSLFMHWRSRQKKPRHKTTTDYFTAMNAEHHRYSIRCLQARQPSFRSSS